MYFRTILLIGLMALVGQPAATFAQVAPTPAAQPAAVPAFVLKKVLIAGSQQNVDALPIDSGGNAPVFVADVTILQGADFPALIAPFIGQPVTVELANTLAATVDHYLKKHDRTLVRYPTPSADPATGILRMAVLVLKYKDLQFRGNHYFSSKLLQDKMGLKSGDDIRVSLLEEAVNWANANPFRQVKVLINELTDQPGRADLIVGVEERLPLRFTAAYDDAGNEILGRNHYSAGIQFGNLWGKDHQGSYQYGTTDDTHLFQSHSLEYRVPLPWRHSLQFTAGYLTTNPSFGAGGVFTQKGENINASIRYSMPLRRGESPIDFTAGFDFKEGNNSLAYGGTVIDRFTTTTDTFQFTSSISMLKRDKLGAWIFAFNVNASPGNVNSRNTNEVIEKGRFNGRARYLTGTLSVQRLLDMGHNWSLLSRLTAQRASANVPGSEQMSIGGSATVRGFEERIFTGDDGFAFSADLQAPPMRYSLPFLKKRPPLDTRVVLFYDAAHVFYRFRNPADIDLPPMASTGVGLRLNLPPNFIFSADYGWQITHLPYQTDRHGRAHIKAVLAF